MNILSIGNSFSQDAQRYLHDIAKADGVNLGAFNLYIGGCQLATHYRNMLSEADEYSLEMNGESSGFKVSLKTALLSRQWDVITSQQASLYSVDYESYQPYLNRLIDYVRHCCPKAKIAIHQTWAYEQGSDMLCKRLGYTDQADMFRDLKESYRRAFEDVGADIFIPSGELLQRLLLSGVERIHRDTYHLSYGVGRYAVGLLWYAILTGNDVTGNSFSLFDEAVSKEEIEAAKKCVSELLRG